MKKILSWIVLFVVLLLIANDPQSATRLVSGTMNLISELANGASTIIDTV
jgi:hypothetical protein